MNITDLAYAVLADKNLANDETVKFLGYCISNAHYSNSQNFQDLWAAYQTGTYSMAHSCRFVEFGATDGVIGSNTLFLEKELNWKGALAEPNPSWHEALFKNRPNARISTDCIFTETGKKLKFIDAGDLSTISGLQPKDEHAAKRAEGKEIEVTTISLIDFLDQGEERTIEYLSIDTEGSEYGILNAFFSDPASKEYKIEKISVEHNYLPIRDKLYQLLTANGYKRVFEPVSRWDDFYILENARW